MKFALVTNIIFLLAVSMIANPAFTQKRTAPMAKNQSRITDASREFHGVMTLMENQYDPDSRLYRYSPERGGAGCMIKIEAKSRDTVKQLLDMAALCERSEPLL